MANGSVHQRPACGEEVARGAHKASSATAIAANATVAGRESGSEAETITRGVLARPANRYTVTR
jgi:hypothetical protein